MANTYDKGDLVRISASCKDSAGALVNPTGLLFKYKVGSGATTTYTYGTDEEVVRTGTGIYYVDLSLTEDDTHYYYRWEATGTGQAAEEGELVVKDSRF